LATAVTAVVVVAVLFAGFGSATALATVTVFVIVVPPAAAVGVTTMVAVALAPAANVPIVQVTVPPACVQVPAVDIADTKITLAGSVSVSVVPVAGFGPLLVTVTV
jgi:hypothetical protein